VGFSSSKCYNRQMEKLAGCDICRGRLNHEGLLEVGLVDWAEEELVVRVCPSAGRCGVETAKRLVGFELREGVLMVTRCEPVGEEIGGLH